MKANSILFVALALHCLNTAAQSRQEAIQYSQTGTGGTALSTGMGGATGAVGGDFSNASTNPAGLGLFRQSELAISPALFNFSSKGTFYGTQEDDRKFNFNISNLHLVLHFPDDNKLKTKGWISKTFAVGFNRNATLHQRYTVRGVNTDGSIVNAMAARANGIISPDNLDQRGDTRMFYDAYLIDPDTAMPPGNYTSYRGMRNGGATQRIALESSGRTGETDIAFAANYSNRLYLGASLAIRRIVYEQTQVHRETNETDSIPAFSSLEYRTRYNDRGTSMALRAGAIYRINDWVRIGASALLPIDYSLTKNYSSELSAAVFGNNFAYASNPSTYSYRLRQPFRFTGSAAFVLGKHGIISVDYETVDYSRTRFGSDDGLLDAENDRMRERLQATGNLRIGAEARFDENYLRAGFQQIGNPVKPAFADFTINQYTLGAGYRDANYYVDLAYVYSRQHYSFVPYSTDLAPTQAADLLFSRHNLVLTLGTRF